jgi:hypothetical protein
MGLQVPIVCLVKQVSILAKVNVSWIVPTALTKITLITLVLNVASPALNVAGLEILIA